VARRGGLHDIGGMKEDLRNQTRWLGQAEFLAAPNLLFRGGKMKCLFAIIRDLKAKRGPTAFEKLGRTRLISGPCESELALFFTPGVSASL
jgi:hypothetical protein